MEVLIPHAHHLSGLHSLPYAAPVSLASLLFHMVEASERPRLPLVSSLDYTYPPCVWAAPPLSLPVTLALLFLLGAQPPPNFISHVWDSFKLQSDTSLTHLPPFIQISTRTKTILCVSDNKKN